MTQLLSYRRSLIGSVLALLLSLMIVPETSATGAGSLPEVSSTGSASQLVEGEPIEAGYLIQDGHYVPPPYVVGSRDRLLYVNGRPAGIIRSNRTKPDGRPRADDRPLASAQDHGDLHPLTPEQEASRARGRLERKLASGLLILQTGSGEFAEFDQVMAQQVLSVLCSSQSREAKLLSLLTRDQSGLDSTEWGRVIDRFEVTPALRKRMQHQLRELGRDAESLTIVHDGSSRTPLFALTVLGMILVVIAFGTVLSARPVGGANWRDEDRSETAVALVFRCILLIAAMSVFDLVCTIVAGSTGRFLEINPLANSLLANPVALIAFKVIFTGIAAAILWRLRYYRGAQVASWWICLLLTLLTVRWVAVESLLMA